ncbi:cytochrome ubiquinol oxidase subunit I [Corallococcus exercitus]|uniref:Cytochrome ubiquinol oxidase subunit I n=1 Tax=Corallococcus exercitus TaxID=2316736 RepID=A0A7Y4KSN3_9BACT|nr:cytochrome ubiquinol oxidase subunit I [Corallococcus exercitus]NOK38610.1 cytochrome ubiquinol oxidase subunit I [Corallococcus exercitus]
MTSLELARWQFGITTVYHFIFVPLTIGLAPLVALLQTLWVVTRKPAWLRLTRLFGKLFLINFALGVVTGIVQEFQFGMNWSEYARFVGDVFGAPLAMEALAAFFIESTFLGLWIFGWKQLPRGLHLASIWLVAFAVNLSGYFILAANSFMQHPVGAHFNPATGRAEMTDILAVLTNNTALVAFPHTVTSAFLVAGTFVAGICGWLMVRSSQAGEATEAQTFRGGLRLGLVTVIVSGIGVAVSGDAQAKLMFQQQPMKMAAAEALCDGRAGAPFSLLAVGDLNNDCRGVRHLLELPGLTSFLASGDFQAPLEGVNDVQKRYEERYGAGQDYAPNLAVTYWSFRLMMGLGVGSAALALVGFWLTRGGVASNSERLARLSLAALPTPFLACSFGWIFTEMGRQPWLVAPNPTGVDALRLLTASGVSTAVSPAMVWTTLIGFTCVYGALAAVWFYLMRHFVRASLKHPAPVASEDSHPETAPLSFGY